jgi:hypothetical protein
VNITSTKVYFSVPATAYSNLTLNSMAPDGNIYATKTGKFNVSITNTGQEYNSKIALYLKSASDSTVNQLISEETVNIAQGETRSLVFSGNITVAPGEYQLYAKYDPTQSGTMQKLGSNVNVTVKTVPTGTPSLSLVSKISFPDANKVPKMDATLTARIKNTVGYYSSQLIAFVFPATGGSSLTYIGYQDATLDTDEVKTFTFNGNINLSAGNYQIIVYCKNASNSWTAIAPTVDARLAFTLVDPTTNINTTSAEVEKVLYPNPVKDILHVMVKEQVKKMVICDVLGNQIKSFIPSQTEIVEISVSELVSGTYILKAVLENSIQTFKFIKE